VTLQPADTHYAGYHFRTRLEARWAVFFDALGADWEYEPQAFELRPLPAAEDRRAEPEDDLHLGRHLPSFWLPGQKAWFDAIRQEPEKEALLRLTRFAALADDRAFVAVGPIPAPESIDDHGHPQGEAFDIHTYGDHHYAWTKCRWCGCFDLTFDARSARTLCGCHKAKYPDFDAPCCNGDKCYAGDAPEIVAAYAAARSARFENDA
jgi:hypothetical protein